MQTRVSGQKPLAGETGAEAFLAFRSREGRSELQHPACSSDMTANLKERLVASFSDSINGDVPTLAPPKPITSR
jgi:hypothetical protein